MWPNPFLSSYTPFRVISRTSFEIAKFQFSHFWLSLINFQKKLKKTDFLKFRNLCPDSYKLRPQLCNKKNELVILWWRNTKLLANNVAQLPLPATNVSNDDFDDSDNNTDMEVIEADSDDDIFPSASDESKEIVESKESKIIESDQSDINIESDQSEEIKKNSFFVQYYNYAMLLSFLQTVRWTN